MVAKFIRGYNHANYVEETICYSFAKTLFLQHPIFYIYFLVRIQFIQTDEQSDIILRRDIRPLLSYSTHDPSHTTTRLNVCNGFVRLPKQGLRLKSMDR